jgi:hypothetical protein
VSGWIQHYSIKSSSDKTGRNKNFLNKFFNKYSPNNFEIFIQNFKRNFNRRISYIAQNVEKQLYEQKENFTVNYYPSFEIDDTVAQTKIKAQLSL